MQRIYLITNKSFYDDTEGVNHQVADYGSLPQVYSSLKKAKKSMMSIKEMYVSQFHYEITKEYPEGREDKPYLVEEYEMVNPISRMRTIMSLWREWIY